MPPVILYRDALAPQVLDVPPVVFGEVSRAAVSKVRDSLPLAGR